MNKKYVALAVAAISVLAISIICIIMSTAPPTQADPDKITLSTSTGTIVIFNQGDTIYCSGNGFQPSTTYDIYMVQETTWTNGMTIPSRIAGSTTTVTSDKSGNINDQQLWSSAQSGKYDVIVDVNHNGKYDAGTDVLYTNVAAGTDLFALPEYTLGGFAALGACFAALLVYKRKSLPSLHLNTHI